MSFAQQSEQTIAQNYDLILDRVKKSRDRFGPAGNQAQQDTTIVAVSKTQPVEKIKPLLDLGHRVFGENRVQEALGKWPALLEKYPGVQLHLVGPLQTNKVRDAVKIFDVIQSLDREKLALALSREIKSRERDIRCFVQVNIGREEQKAGIDPDGAVKFVERCREEHGLDIVGLMCIPPLGEAAGPYFAQLAILAERAGVKCLSMGMSGDFETAMEMGATHVRIGTALFGARQVSR